MSLLSCSPPESQCPGCKSSSHASNGGGDHRVLSRKISVKGSGGGGDDRFPALQDHHPTVVMVGSVFKDLKEIFF